MRHFAIVVLVLSVAAGACNQSQPGTASGQPRDLAGSAGSGTMVAEPPATSPGAPAVSATPAPAGGAAQPTMSSGAPAKTGQPASMPASALASSGGAATAAPQAASAAPTFDEVTVPAGTELSLVLDTPVASDTSSIEGPVRAHLAKTVSVNGIGAIPLGSVVAGSVTDVERAGKVKGLAHIAFRFHALTRTDDSERYRIETSSVSRTARATKGKDAAKVGGGALGGAIVGGIIGGKKGAAIGTGVGAGAGGAVVMSTRGENVRLGRGATVSVRLSQAITIRVPRG